jgi:hypothetical protein
VPASGAEASVSFGLVTLLEQAARRPMNRKEEGFMEPS